MAFSQTGQTKYRPRLQLKFWLYRDDDVDLEIYNEHQQLKRAKKWRETVVDALRLYLSLKDNCTDVLFDLFPEVRRSIEANVLADLQSKQAFMLPQQASVPSLAPIPPKQVDNTRRMSFAKAFAQDDLGMDTDAF